MYSTHAWAHSTIRPWKCFSHIVSTFCRTLISSFFAHSRQSSSDMFSFLQRAILTFSHTSRLSASQGVTGIGSETRSDAIKRVFILKIVRKYFICFFLSRFENCQKSICREWLDCHHVDLYKRACMRESRPIVSVYCFDDGVFVSHFWELAYERFRELHESLESWLYQIYHISFFAYTPLPLRNQAHVYYVSDVV